MLPAPDLDTIDQRLARIDLEQWGPDGIRYVCILFWNELGHRMLSHHFDVQAWERWSHSSGEFWDCSLPAATGTDQPTSTEIALKRWQWTPRPEVGCRSVGASGSPINSPSR